jgi:hypothetical protein
LSPSHKYLGIVAQESIKAAEKIGVGFFCYQILFNPLRQTMSSVRVVKTVICQNKDAEVVDVADNSSERLIH